MRQSSIFEEQVKFGQTDGEADKQELCIMDILREILPTDLRKIDGYAPIWRRWHQPLPVKERLYSIDN